MDTGHSHSSLTCPGLELKKCLQERNIQATKYVATMNPSSKGSIVTLWQPLKSLLTSTDLNKMFSCMCQESFPYTPRVTRYVVRCFTLVFGKSIINILC